jgi:hypothetical protein
MNVYARLTYDGGYPYTVGSYVQVYDVEGEFTRVHPISRTTAETDMIRTEFLRILPPDTHLCEVCRLPCEEERHVHCRTFPVRGKRGLTRWGGGNWNP